MDNRVSLVLAGCVGAAVGMVFMVNILDGRNENAKNLANIRKHSTYRLAADGIGVTMVDCVEADDECYPVLAHGGYLKLPGFQWSGRGFKLEHLYVPYCPPEYTRTIAPEIQDPNYISVTCAAHLPDEALSLNSKGQVVD